MLNEFIRAESARFGLPLNLIETRFPETYSQAGEDLIIEALFGGIVAKVPPSPSIYYLDIGANHPIHTSNTYLFYKKHNSQGVLFDADPELIGPLKRVRPRDTVVHAAVSARHTPTVTLNVCNAKELSSLTPEHVTSFANMGAAVVKQIEVPNLHIADLLAQYGQQPIQYMSVDIESEDLAVLRAIDFNRYRPWIISCEPSTQVNRQTPQEMYAVMAQAGYMLVARTFVNMIFLDKRFI
jgi:FkbM family methyltransferase